MRSQIVTSKARGGRRTPPYVFTEQGVAMLSSVLRSEQAVQVNIAIMRAFVKLRQMLSSHQELARKLDAMEEKYDEQFRIVFDAIRELMAPPEPNKKRPIGYIWKKTNNTSRFDYSRTFKTLSPHEYPKGIIKGWGEDEYWINHQDKF